MQKEKYFDFLAYVTFWVPKSGLSDYKSLS